MLDLRPAPAFFFPASKASRVHLRFADWIVVLLYLGGTLWLAHRARSTQGTLRDYFLADGRLSWFTSGLCLFATLFSTVSFVAIPGEAYRHGVLFSLNSIGYALFTPLAVWLFLRFFYSTSAFTAYEYLERRYDRRVRIVGAVVFLVARALYAAIVFYSAAAIFETLLGWSPWMTIGVIGFITIFYAFYGGMKAIALTDVMQSLIILGAVGFIVGKLIFLIHFDFAALIEAVQANGRGFGAMQEASFYSTDPKVRYSLWTALALALIGPLTNYGTDQLFIQRMLSTKSYGEAKKAIWLKTLVALPVSLTLYLIGLLMYFYYEHIVGQAPAVAADQLLGYFINQHMPSPMPGLVASALLAALMSTVSSTSASLATVTAVDVAAFLPGVRKWRALKSVQGGRILTAAWGVLAIGLALVLAFAGRSVESTVLEVSQVWAGLWLILLAVVLGGIATTWVTARAALLALVVGITCNLAAPYLFYYRVPMADRISFIWVGMPGFLLTGLILVVVSWFDPRKPQRLEGLTFRTAVRSGAGPAS